MFFQTASKGPRSAPKTDAARESIIALRKQNHSVYDIQRALEESGQSLSPAAISKTLAEEGFARLPRRADEERPQDYAQRPLMLPMYGNWISLHDLFEHGLVDYSFSFPFSLRSLWSSCSARPTFPDRK